MPDQFARTRLLIGQDGLDALANARVIVFGLGGVGGYVVEALARAGVGHLHLVDNDTVDLTNLNRQIIATHNTIGQPKVQVMASRVAAINPACQVECSACFYLPETRAQFDFRTYDYIVDAIDTVSAKIDLVLAARDANTPVISCMGTGNRLDPERLHVADISQTHGCPLARTMRRELRKRGITSLTCVYSDEPPVSPHYSEGEAPETKSSGRPAPGSISYVPGTAGLLIAGVVIRELLKQD